MIRLGSTDPVGLQRLAWLALMLGVGRRSIGSRIHDPGSEVWAWIRDPGSRTDPLRRFPSVASLPSFSLQWFPCPVFFFMMDEAVGRGWWWVGQALPRPTALVPVGLATTFRLWPRPPPVQGGRGRGHCSVSNPLFPYTIMFPVASIKCIRQHRGQETSSPSPGPSATAT